MQKRKVLILLTGGTITGNIASHGKHGKSKTEKLGPVNFIPVLQQPIRILKKDWNVQIDPQIDQLFNMDSSDMRPYNWTKIAGAIEKNYDEFEAFILLHGTNTMGYTSAALSFALENINKPVIVTGAQVPLGYLGSDATTNLVNALRLAAWTYHEIKGVMVVFGSKIISGVRVKKGTDFDFDPFSPFLKGALGHIGRFIRIEEPALAKHNSYLSRERQLAGKSESLVVSKNFDTAGIASLTEFPGMSADIFKCLVENNKIRAFILRAFGAGDVSTHFIKALEYLKRNRIPIVITTQTPNGVASFQVNENGRYVGNNKLAIPAFDMNIESITAKLGWLLGQRLSYEEIQNRMVQDLRGEITIENEPH